LGVQELGRTLDGDFGASYPSMFAYFKGFLEELNNWTNEQNSGMLDKFPVLDESVQKKIYSMSLNLYDVDANGLTGKYKTVDPFEAARIIYMYNLAILQTTYTTVPTSDVRIDFIQNNILNELLLTGDKIIKVLEDDLTTQIDFSSARLVIFEAVALAILGIFFIMTIYIIHSLNTGSSYFISYFSRISDEDALISRSVIEKYILTVRDDFEHLDDDDIQPASVKAKKKHMKLQIQVKPKTRQN
jgi:hypothetical protein